MPEQESAAQAQAAYNYQRTHQQANDVYDLVGEPVWTDVGKYLPPTHEEMTDPMTGQPTTNRDAIGRAMSRYGMMVNVRVMVSITQAEYDHLRSYEAHYAGALMEIRRLNEQVVSLVQKIDSLTGPVKGNGTYTERDAFEIERTA